jgi:hypothetical protein
VPLSPFEHFFIDFDKYLGHNARVFQNKIEKGLLRVVAQQALFAFGKPLNEIHH